MALRRGIRAGRGIIPAVPSIPSPTQNKGKAMTAFDSSRPGTSLPILAVQYPQLYAYLKERFVSLPEPYGTRGWVVDLRDPFHPVVQRYETWPEADAACEREILTVLAEMVAIAGEGAPAALFAQKRHKEPLA
jgi:hypothetical protein